MGPHPEVQAGQVSFWPLFSIGCLAQEQYKKSVGWLEEEGYLCLQLDGKIVQFVIKAGKYQGLHH